MANVRKEKETDLLGQHLLSKERRRGPGTAVCEYNSEGVDVNRSNPGWADAMARVLNSKKRQKTRSIVLSRAKKLNEPAKTLKEEETAVEAGGVKQEVTNLRKHTRRKQQELQCKCRVKPSILDRDREKRLKKIATRGVVQLFNAVDQQQKRLESQLNEAGGSERKREKVIRSLDKRAFIDILMGHSHSEAVDSPVKLEAKLKEETHPTWHVLHDDFMLGTARLKDWDKTDAPT